ncbi:response regulator [Parapusillimonas granuli]|uniref:Response regulator n=1 Tax=Parapusillimonas granuli TaxID=380911 RepID=A0A853FX47_9BURK|nr:response regulator [Parapusillimonas granuli]MBB5214184.1 CheY-like chemotaxis protein [Parapusillimonas granuli]MEB2399011.1 response regulator [Alcaligenaceae bacterium]NYT50605.1 response regulator [Parapusillimonas granuli]
MALIVVADDEMLLTEMLAAVLEDAGYDVLLAAHGKEALDLVKQNRPRLLITDFMMPVMTGLELAEVLRQDHEFTDLPILLVTGAQGAVARRHPELFTRVLDKPYSLQQLLDVVAEMVPV